jgi:surface carbohydrate biosynthesis protein
MSRTDVVLVVDQKWRDLPGMAALAVWLEEAHGLRTELIPYARWRETLVMRRPKVIVLTHMNGSRNRAIADLAASMGTRVAVIQAEGRPNNSYAMEYAVGKGSDPRGVDLWFTWSDTVRTFMIDRGLLPSEKIVTAGVHRFDFYRPPLDGLLEGRLRMAARYGLDAGRPIVTLATNFTCTKYHNRNQQFLVDDWKNLGLSQFKAYSDPADFAKRDVEAREATLEMMRALLKARPAIQLAIKPHPTEEHDRYKTFADQMRREHGATVAFIGLEYIWNVLSASDVHLHRLCTTGVEAWFMNVPSIDVHVADYHGWSLKLEGAAAEAVEGNDLVTTTAELIERVDHYLNGGAAAPEKLAARVRYVEKWLDQIDGRRVAAHARALADLAHRTSVAAPARLADTLMTLARRIRSRIAGDTWSGEAGLAGRSGLVDAIGQVDARISPADADAWKEKVRPVIRQALALTPDA